MTEKPILFSGRLVRAILAGKKTQTRRVIKPKQMPPYPLEFEGNNDVGRSCLLCAMPVPSGFRQPHAAWCKKKTPYGNFGDQLWVRETWYCDDFRCGKEPSPAELIPSFVDALEFRADHDCGAWEAGCPCNDGDGHGSWRPSIFMPRWASRIQLAVTGIRVERLQDITPDAAIAEGATEWGTEESQRRMYDAEGKRRKDPGHPVFDGTSRGIPYLVNAFAELWDSINAKRGYSWESNPWVWVVEFERIDNR